MLRLCAAPLRWPLKTQSLSPLAALPLSEHRPRSASLAVAAGSGVAWSFAGLTAAEGGSTAAGGPSLGGVSSAAAAAFAVPVTHTSAAAAPDAAAALILDSSSAAVSFTSSHPGLWLHMWPPFGVAKLIEAVHVIGGAEWWLAVAIASAALRVVALPFFLRTAHTGALMQHHQVAMSAITDELAVARKAQDAERMRALTAQYRAFLTDKGIHLGRGVFVPLVVQTTLAISAFTATRHLAADVALVPGVADAVGTWLPGGVALPDPTFMLPAASGLFSCASIALNKSLAGLPQAELTPAGQRLLFSGFALLFSGVTAAMPATQQLYIVVTAAFMLLQQTALRVGVVKRTLNFPHDWPLSPEALNERIRRRELLGLDTSSPITDNLKGFAGIFRRVSDVAEGTWRRRPVHTYISVWGLRDPGPPLPPSGEPTSVSKTATSELHEGLPAAFGVISGADVRAHGSSGGGSVLFTHRPKRMKTVK